MPYIEEYRSMAKTVRGPSRRSNSERKTTVAKVNSPMAQCTLVFEGRVEFGARSMRRYREMFAVNDVRAVFMVM